MGRLALPRTVCDNLHDFDVVRFCCAEMFAGIVEPDDAAMVLIGSDVCPQKRTISLALNALAYAVDDRDTAIFSWSVMPDVPPELVSIVNHFFEFVSWSASKLDVYHGNLLSPSIRVMELLAL